MRQAKAQRSALALDVALKRYLRHCAGENDAGTIADKAGAFASHVRPALAGAPLSNINRSDWLAILDVLTDRPGMRRNLYAYTRHFLGWAVERDLMDANPLSGVAPPKPLRRGIARSAMKRSALWRVEGETVVLARLALLTAQRQGSLAAMRWDQLDLDQAAWRIPPEARPHVHHSGGRRPQQSGCCA